MFWPIIGGDWDDTKYIQVLTNQRSLCKYPCAEVGAKISREQIRQICFGRLGRQLFSIYTETLAKY